MVRQPGRRGRRRRRRARPRRPRRCAVVAYDPATGALKALRTGTAVLRVTVNGMTAERTVAVHRG
ncbi:hypothetical protein OH779_37605 [Actinacidiphila glaucinigra]|uniref:hypothetical protein n=1 Tax=Actinacidiphila glaucinigra TaxID=235986 RepID=UPI00386D95E9